MRSSWIGSQQPRMPLAIGGDKPRIGSTELFDRVKCLHCQSLPLRARIELRTPETNDMQGVLNRPERVVNNILAADSIMHEVDGILNKERLLRFAVGVSRILAHAQPSLDGLCSVVHDEDARLEVFAQIFNSATELETAWNCLRLANVPASQRQGRVAMESIGTAIVFSLPVPVLLKELPRNDFLAKWLRNHPEKTAIDAYTPPAWDDDEPQRMGPAVRTTQIFNSFLTLAEAALEMPAEAVEGLKEYRRWVQHPASHGSAELSAYHFQTFASGSVGALFDPQRADTYIKGASDLIDIAYLIADILDLGTRYVAGD
jgi:hypothetical protein